MVKKNQSIIYYVLPFLILIASIGFLYLINIKISQNSNVQATKGELRLTEHQINSYDVIELNGEWEFYHEQLLQPESFQNEVLPELKRDYISVPSSWKEHVSKGERLPSHGYATYRLQLFLPDDTKDYGLAINSITSAYTLWINGEMVDKKGEVGRTRETTKPFKTPEVVKLSPINHQAEIVIQVANFTQRKAGIFASVDLGDYELLRNLKSRKIVLEALMIGFILITGIHHLVLFARMNTRFDSLWFGIICVILGIKNSVDGQYVLSILIPDLSDNVSITIEYLGFMASPILFTLFFYHLFPRLISKKIRTTLWVPGAFFILLTILLPVHLFVKFATVMQIYAVIAALILIHYILKAISLKMEGAILLAIGASVFFVTIINDILMNNGTMHFKGSFFSFGLLFMILCMEIILSFKLYNAYDTIKKMSQRMMELDRVKNEFLSNTSHELRTPLNGMIGLAQSLLYGLQGKLEKTHELHLQMIVSSGQRLSYLINDILDYSRLNNNDIRLQLTQVNIYQLVEVVLTIVQPLTAGRELTLNNKVAENFPFVKADEGRLEQILFNLIGNAIKYTPKGHVSVGASWHEDHVKIYVEDTGIGIAADKFDVIFKRFEQLDEPGEVGSGLGLKITKQLVKMHGGTISVQSKQGEGSRFEFSLYTMSVKEEVNREGNSEPVKLEPLMKQSPVLASKTLSAKEVATTLQPMLDDSRLPEESKLSENDYPYKILVVDDEAINLQVVTQQLALHNYLIDIAINGEQVMKQLTHLFEYDLIIADIMMPGMSGFELSERIRERYSLDELPILIMTAGYREDTITTAFNVGANDYISKPFGRNELLSRVKSLILLRRAVLKVKQNAKELNQLNEQLTNLNVDLEHRIQERTMELKEMNDVLKIRNEELNRLESARRRLMIDVSHELRTPITAIQGYIEAIATGVIESKEEQKDYLKTILVKVHMLNRSIQDLFELSRLESRRSEMIFEITPLKDLIDQIKDKFSFDVQKAELIYHFQTNINPNDVNRYQVIIDMDRINQVLNNLIFNSIKYTAKGGKVSISCLINVQTEIENAAGEMVIHVEDTGHGINPESVPHIFERFYQDKNRHTRKGMERGSGIGLAIAKEIVQYHDGEIHVKSSILGEGTIFSITLPLYQFDDN